MIFAIPIMTIFVNNFSNHLKDDNVLIFLKDVLYLLIIWWTDNHFILRPRSELSSKNKNLGLKLNILKFLGIRPKYHSF